MHIPDNILPVAAYVGGYAATGALMWHAVREIRQQDDPCAEISRAALLTSIFFLATWVYLPIPPISVHLLLNGLLGAILGYYAIPVIFIGLFLQAAMFQHGGVTALGINTLIMALPALFSWQIFRLRTLAVTQSCPITGLFGFLTGATGPALSVIVVYGLLTTTISPAFDTAIEMHVLTTLVFSYAPDVLLEGILATAVLLVLQRFKPAVLESAVSGHMASTGEPVQECS